MPPEDANDEMEDGNDEMEDANDEIIDGPDSSLPRPTVVISLEDSSHATAGHTHDHQPVVNFDVTPLDTNFSRHLVVLSGDGATLTPIRIHYPGGDVSRFVYTLSMGRDWTGETVGLSVPENVFRGTGGSQDNNLGDDFYVTLDAAAGGTGDGVVGHDPYVHSANGKITKIPDKHGYYRMFEHDDMFVNVEVDKLNIKEALDAFYEEKGFDTALLGGKKPITKGYWNKSLFIESEGHVLQYDIFGEALATRQDMNYFQVKLVNAKSRRRMREMCVDDVVRKTALISWSHTKHGRQQLTLDWYANPQVQNGVALTSRLAHSKDSIGLFVKNYEAKYMELDALDTGKCVRLHRDMKAAKRAGKKLTHERPIKAHGEAWFVRKGNRVQELTARN